MKKILIANAWHCINIGDIARPAVSMLRAGFPDLRIIKACDVGNRPAIRSDLVAAIDEADLFIVGSGRVHAAPLAVWRATTDKPFGVHGVTFGNISSDLARTLKEAAFVYCRDSVSVALLRKAGISGPQRESCADEQMTRIAAVDTRGTSSGRLHRVACRTSAFIVRARNQLDMQDFHEYSLMHAHTVRCGEQ